MTKRRISGFKPTGPLQLGNYVGAIRPMVQAQYEQPSVAFIADLHALTVRHDPARLHQLSMEVAGLLLAAGIDPEHTILYRQSDLPAHAELHYLLECVAGYGEAHRMIQFKEKGGDGSRLSLLTYPVLMAADILLHDIEEVPVGHDQRQHVELTRDLAVRFNERYGTTLTVPEAVHPAVARIKDLAEPTAKMGKTNISSAGVLFMLDPPDVLRRKIMRAVTDTGTEVTYDPERKPGVSNLLDILTACTGNDTHPGGEGYGRLKSTVADEVIELLRPIQERYHSQDPAEVAEILANGAERARERADRTVRRVREALGLTSKRLTNERLTNERLTNERLTSARPARADSPATPAKAAAPY
jgi:tryptophanyl-tRNA synthetase